MTWRQRRRRTQGSQLASGGGGGSGGGSSRRERRLRGRVTVRRRPRCPPPHDLLGKCTSPITPRRVRGLLAWRRCCSGLGPQPAPDGGPPGPADPWALGLSLQRGETWCRGHMVRSRGERRRRAGDQAAWDGQEGGTCGGWDGKGEPEASDLAAGELRMGGEKVQCPLSAAGEDVLVRRLLTSWTQGSGGGGAAHLPETYTPYLACFHFLLEVCKYEAVGCFHRFSFNFVFH